MAITVLGAAALAAWLLLRPRRLEVTGWSMAPTLVPGDWVLAFRPPRFRLGDVVVVEHPQIPGYEMVKRIKGVPGQVVGDTTLAQDDWWVEGDEDQASTDSRDFGAVSGGLLKARVVVVYGPQHRRRLVR